MKKVVVFFVCCLCLSCWFGFHSRKIYQNYYLVSLDTKENSSVSYKLDDGNFIERVPSVAGFSIVKDEWLLVRQKINNEEKYYIVSIKKDDGYAELDRIREGPYDHRSFSEVCKERFKLDKVTFIK